MMIAADSLANNRSGSAEAVLSQVPLSDRDTVVSPALCEQLFQGLSEDDISAIT